jgi:hypothetical protein
MPRGGKREGAGRPLAASTLRSREIAQEAIQKGITPLEVMLENMRFAHEGAAEHLAKITGVEPDVAVELMKGQINLRDFAQECAKDAAPYVHAKLANMELTGKDGKDLIPDTVNLNLIKPDGPKSS